MIGPSGFGQAPAMRWCPKCEDYSERNERGCVSCATLREKHAHIQERYGSYHAAAAMDRRTRLLAANVCINAISHGPPEPGKTKCTRCLEQHRRSNR